ncbi:MAG TPA: leucine-rich repeat protein [Ruminococcus sp.]|nr:leucine-rich repeat protein [Ruminococcus sp.]
MNGNIITDKDYYELNGIRIEFYFDAESDGYILEWAGGHSDTLFIPNTINGKPVKYIEFADWGTGGYDKVIVSENNPYFKAVDGVLFTGDMKELLIYPIEKKDKVYFIPDGVELIGEDSFNSNKYINTLVFPHRFKLIVQYTLAVCENLETLYLPATLERVLLKAFYAAGPLRNVYYEGTEQDWNNIDFTDCNWSLTDAEIHFNYDYQKIKF